MRKKTYEIGSGNVFKYLGVPNAEEHLIKAQLVYISPAKQKCIPDLIPARRASETGPPSAKRLWALVSNVTIGNLPIMYVAPVSPIHCRLRKRPRSDATASLRG